MTKSQEKSLNKFISEFKNTHILSEDYKVKELEVNESEMFTTLIITVGNSYDEQTSRIMITKRGKVMGYNNKGQKVEGIINNLFQ